MTRSSAPFPHLVADIGGTNARFGWIAREEAAIAHVQVLPCADHPTLGDAVRHYLAAQQLPAPASMAMGIATPVVDDLVRMTNHHWAFSQRGLKDELGLQRLQVLNDFTTLALALPSLPAAQLRQLGGAAVLGDAPKALIGPGTGLGVSGLLPSAAGWVAIAGEGGHVTLAAENDREAAVIARMRQRHGHVSAERAVCGSGLVSLYEALCQIDGRDVEALLPSDVTTRGLAASDPACAEALSLFCAWLGCVAGNLALTLGARGGVYIGGGIVPRLGMDFVAASPLRERFEAKGRFRAYLQPIPLLIVDASVSPALEGAASALRQA